MTEDATNFLFREIGHDFGSDLVARNIQRGRDHGLPGYNSWRKFCGLSSISSMSRGPAEIPSRQWEVLRSLYSAPNKIDLFTGGLAETAVADGLTGPTFNCIKAKQFASLKDGDRSRNFNSAQTTFWIQTSQICQGSSSPTRIRLEA